MTAIAIESALVLWRLSKLRRETGIQNGERGEQWSPVIALELMNR